MPDDKLPIPEFAKRIKQKYPQYNGIADTLLVQKIVDKYPEYKESIDFGIPQQESAQQYQQPSYFNLPIDRPEDLLHQKVNSAAKTLDEELYGNDDVIAKDIKQMKLNNVLRDETDQYLMKNRIDAPHDITIPKEFLPKERRQPEVSPDELKEAKSIISQNESLIRKHLDMVAKSKPEKKQKIEAAMYVFDSKWDLGKEGKIAENARKIQIGALNYDIKHGILIKPEGFLKSIATSWKHKDKLLEDADTFTDMSDEELANELDKRRASIDKHDPISVPEGNVAKIGEMIGGQPASALVAGAVTTMGGAPEAAPFVGAYVGGGQFGKMTYAAQTPDNYYRLLDMGIPRLEAAKRARTLARNQGISDALSGAAMSYVGVKMGTLPKVNLSGGFGQGLQELAKKSGVALTEAGVVGGLQGASQATKNILSTQAGIKKETGEGVFESTVSGGGFVLLMKLGMGALAKGSEAVGISKKSFNSIKDGLSKIKDDESESLLKELIDEGRITEDEATKVRIDLTEERKLNESIDASYKNVTDDARAGIKEKIERRVILDQRLKIADDAAKDGIKEKITKVNEDINELAKDKIKTSDISEDAKVVNKAIDNGDVQGMYAISAKSNPEQLIKEAADQALNRIAPEYYTDEQAMTQAKELYGEDIVAHAIKKYPTKQKITVSTPNIVNVKLKENAGTIRSDQGQVSEGREVPEISENPRSENIQLDEGATPTSPAAGTQEVIGKTEGEGTGITHEATAETRKAFGLPEYEKQYKSDVELNAAADEAIKSGYNMEGLVKKMEAGFPNTDLENTILKKYKPILEEKLKTDPSDENLDFLHRLVKASDLTGSIQARGFRARQGTEFADESLSGFFTRDRETNADAPLTEQQKATVQKEFDAISKAKDELAAKNAKLEEELTKAKAEKNFQNIKSTKPKTKRTHEDYVKERQSLVEKLKQQRDEHIESMRNQGIQQMGGTGGIVLTAKMAKTIGEIVKSFAEEGIEKGVEQLQKLEGVIKAVHENVKDIFEGITEKDIHNVIAGVYNEKGKTKSELAIRMRDLGDEAKLINQYQALINGVEPKNEKARIKRNQEITTLREKIKAFKGEETEANKFYGESEAQQKKIERMEDELNRLKERREKEPKETIKREISGKEKELKQQIYEERKQFNKEKAEANKFYGEEKSADQKKLESILNKNEAEIKKIKEDIAAGKFGKEKKISFFDSPEIKEIKKTNPDLYKRVIESKDKLIKVRLDREDRLERQEFENRTKLQKAKDLGQEALDAARVMQTNPDLSFTGRQGLIYFVTHPIEGSKVFWNSVLNAKDPKRYDRWINALHESSAWPLIEKSGVSIIDPKSLHASKRSEGWRSKLIERVPILGPIAKASGRAFATGENMARVNFFLEGVKVIREKGKSFESYPKEYTDWGSAVNNMTGRGGLGKLEPVANTLAVPFWSPRLMVSRINLFLNPMYYIKMSPVARMMLLKNMGQYIFTTVGLLAAAKAAGVDVETDPRSSDFGKVRVGDTRYDFTGGAAQYVRVLAQFFSSQRKSAKGKHKVLDLKEEDRLMVPVNMIRGKLSPVWGFGLDATIGKNLVGDPVEWTDAYKLMIPMLKNDIKDAAKDGGADAAAVAGMASFLGISVQTYDANKKKPKQHKK